MVLTEHTVDKAYAKLRDTGHNVRWDGWDLVFFHTSPRGRWAPSGTRHNGVWGFETRVSPNTDGRWIVSKRTIDESR